MNSNNIFAIKEGRGRGVEDTPLSNDTVVSCYERDDFISRNHSITIDIFVASPRKHRYELSLNAWPFNRDPLITRHYSGLIAREGPKKGEEVALLYVRFVAKGFFKYLRGARHSIRYSRGAKTAGARYIGRTIAGGMSCGGCIFYKELLLYVSMAYERSRILLQLDFHTRRVCISHGVLPTIRRRHSRSFFTFQYHTERISREEPAETEIDRNTCIMAPRGYRVY